MTGEGAGEWYRAETIWSYLFGEQYTDTYQNFRDTNVLTQKFLLKKSALLKS